MSFETQQIGNRLLSAQVLSSLVLLNQMAAAPALAFGQPGHGSFAGGSTNPHTQFTQNVHAFAPTTSSWHTGHSGAQFLPASFGMGVTTLTSQSLPLPQTNNNAHSTNAFLSNGHNGHGQFASHQSTLQAQMNTQLAASQSVQLDLTSTNSSVVLDASTVRTGSVTINVGGTSSTFHVGDKVTAAELVAIEQAQVRTGQTIQLDSDGRATGGTFSLNSVTNAAGLNITSVVVPSNVTAVDRVGVHSNVNLSGDLINYGSIVEVGGHVGAKANISAQDIINETGGLITSKMFGKIADLNLTALQDFTNMGTITSSGNLGITAGGTLTNSGVATAHNNVTLQSTSIVNSGTVSSSTGNINLGVANGSDQSAAMNIDNTGGTLSAMQGAINVRDAAYVGTGNTTVVGGDLLSKELNLNSGAGLIDVNVDQLTGTVTSAGDAVHVHAATDNLVIGKQCLVGDPTYYNDSGDITLDGNINVGEDLTIIASGDILSTSKLQTITANDGTNGKNITIVAGANVTGGVGETTNTISATPPVAGNAIADVSFTGASSTGGNIDFGKATLPFSINTSSGSGNGGNITLAAYNDGTTPIPAKGSINMSNISTLDASASTGTAGDVTILAGSQSASSFLGAISGRNVTISTSQPSISGGGTIVFNSAGAVTSGNAIVRDLSAPLGDRTVTLANNINASGNVDVSAGFLLDAANVSTTTGSILMTSPTRIDISGIIQTTQGGNILLVSGMSMSSYAGSKVITDTAFNNIGAGSITMVAGAAFTQSSTDITITGPSNSGGDLNLVNAAGSGRGPISALSARSMALQGFGGAITLVAYADQLTSLSGGLVVLPSAVTITTAGAGSGSSGNVIVVANGKTDAIGTAANPLNIDTTGGSNGSGNITLSASQANQNLFVLPGLQFDPNSFLGGTQTAAIDGAIHFGTMNTSNAYFTLVHGGPFVVPTTLPSSSNIVIQSAGDIQAFSTYSSNKSIALLAGRDIQLGADLVATGGIAVIAGRNISSSTNINISTATNAGDSGSITVAAGAAFTVALNQIFITGASATGGSIDFKAAPVLSLSTATSNFALNSGNIVLSAQADNVNGSKGGFITLPSNLTANTSAFDTQGGYFIAVSGAKSGVGLDLGSVNTTSQNGATTSGSITLQTVTPAIGPLTNYIVNLNGSTNSNNPTNFSASAVNPADIHAGTLTSLGGSIIVTGGGNLQITALNAQGRNNIGPGGGSNGRGGSVQVRNYSATDDLDIGAASGNNYITSILANGVAGGISASGGSVDISLNSAKNLVISNVNAIQFDATSAPSGKGGDLTLTNKLGTIDFGPLTGLNSNSSNAPQGGSISLTANDFEWDSKGKGTPFTINTSGGTSAAGNLYFENLGTTVFSIGPATSKTADFTFKAEGGNANVTYLSKNAAVNVDGAGFDLTATNSGIQGSRLLITALGIHNSSGPIALDASSTNGSGGTINVQDLANENIVVGTGAGNFILTAQGGVGSTSGGSVYLSTLGSLTVDPTQIKVGSASATAFNGLISLTAGTTLLVNGNFNLDNGPTGKGGDLTLISNSATPFSVGGTKLTNGITGTISVGTGTSSSVNIQNLGGAIISNDFMDAKTISLLGFGPVTVNSALGSSTTTKVNLIAGNGGAVTATKQTIQTLSANFGSDTGAITVSKLNAASVSAVTDKAAKTAVVAITNVNTVPLDISSAQGSKITVITPGNLTSSGTIQGGPVTLTSTGKTGTTINLGGSVNSTGLVTVTAPGAITFGSNLNGDLGVKVANKDANANITFKNSGTINTLATGTITITSGAGSIIQGSGNDMNGAKTITLTAAKGSVTLGGAGHGALAPLALTVSALNGITVVGPVVTTNSISLKTTSTAVNGGDIILNNSLNATSSKSTVTVTAGSNSAITDAGAPFNLNFQGNAVTLTGPAGVTLSSSQLQAGTKAATIAAAKGNVKVDTITSTLGNVAISALNGIILTGPINAATTVVVKSTNTKANADISLRASITTGTTGSITITAPTGSQVTDSKANPHLTSGTITVVGPSGISFSGGTELQSTSKSITLTSAKGAVNLSVIGKVTAATNLAVSTLNGLTSSAQVQAVTGITVTATDKTNGNLTISNTFKSTGVGSKVTLTANGTGGLSSGGQLSSDGLFTVKAAAGPITLNGSSIQSNSGAISLTGVDYDGTQGGSSVHAQTTIAIVGTGKGAANFVKTGNTATNNGLISVKGAGGLVSTSILMSATGTDAKTKTTILINNTNTALGKIDISGDVLTHAFSTGKGNGNIIIAVGTAPTTGKNPIVTGDVNNITVTHGGAGTGKVYGGVTAKTGGIVGTAPVITLRTVESADVILNTPSAANPITFASGSNVIADPPPVTLASVVHLQNTMTAQPVGQTAGQSIQTSSIGSLATATTQQPPLHGAVTVYQLGNPTSLGGGSAASLGSTGFGAGSQFGQGLAWISDTEVAGGRIPASLHQIAGETKLDGGSLLVAPDADSVIKTSMGKISIKAKSLVLVLTFSGGVAVYNLHDTCKNAVQLEAGGRTLSILPGRSAVVVSDHGKRFEEVNPAQLICYGPLAETTLASDMKVFHGEFSLPSAINAVPTLRNLLSSREVKNKKLADQFLKTTSIMMQLRNNASQFRQIQKPQLTAFNR